MFYFADLYQISNTLIMGKIKIKTIRLFSNHGCMEEEAQIGSHYAVDICVKTSLKKSSYSDNLKDTVDYVKIHQIVKNQMLIRSKLIEHVAKRIIDELFVEFKQIKKIKISVSKLNPPIEGDVKKVSAILKEKRG